jgi:hypothetical protein
MNTTIISVAHLAKRAMESSARCEMIGEFNSTTRLWDLIVSEDLADTLQRGATAVEMDLSDFVIHYFSRGE